MMDGIRVAVCATTRLARFVASKSIKIPAPAVPRRLATAKLGPQRVNAKTEDIKGIEVTTFNLYAETIISYL